MQYLHIFLNLRISEHSAPQKESGKLEGKVSKCRFCCLLQISAPHLVFFWAPCIGGQTNYGGAISGHTFPTSRLSGRTPSPSSAPIAFLELVKDEEWPQWAYEGSTRPKQTFEPPRLKAVLRWVPIQPGGGLEYKDKYRIVFVDFARIWVWPFGS